MAIGELEGGADDDKPVASQRPNAFVRRQRHENSADSVQRTVGWRRRKIRHIWASDPDVPWRHPHGQNGVVIVAASTKERLEKGKRG